jgi:hypothetical protein
MHAGTPISVDEASEEQFLARLRDATQRFLESLDAWEAQYQKYYRVPSPSSGSVSADLESLHQNYLDARKDLQKCVPRARRLCLKYGLREPWQAMLHIALGARTPQSGATSAIGKAERTLLAKCLADLEAASVTYAEPPTPAPVPPPQPRGILQRVFDYFL